MSDQFSNVSVVIKANVLFEGRCISHTVLFEDGSQKMLGVILPNVDGYEEYEFTTETSERIEIISGECSVKIQGQEDYVNYRAGQSFMVSGDSAFFVQSEQIIHYICHLEG